MVKNKNRYFGCSANHPSHRMANGEGLWLLENPDNQYFWQDRYDYQIGPKFESLLDAFKYLRENDIQVIDYRNNHQKMLDEFYYS